MVLLVEAPPLKPAFGTAIHNSSRWIELRGRVGLLGGLQWTTWTRTAGPLRRRTCSSSMLHQSTSLWDPVALVNIHASLCHCPCAYIVFRNIPRYAYNPCNFRFWWMHSCAFMVTGVAEVFWKDDPLDWNVCLYCERTMHCTSHFHCRLTSLNIAFLWTGNAWHMSDGLCSLDLLTVQMNCKKTPWKQIISLNLCAGLSAFVFLKDFGWWDVASKCCEEIRNCWQLQRPTLTCRSPTIVKCLQHWGDRRC